MFYNHDILTDRKHGVATIWLVATLGSKSSLRKVTRKAILDVDVPSACETITDPSAPLALRLQGSLLFGVSRVFSQQCGYVLTDMQSLRDKMRGITMLLKELEVDPDVVTTRPEQLNLQIDPGFSIDLDLGFDLSGFDLHDYSTDEPSSLLSPRTSASSRTSLYEDELGLNEPLGAQDGSSSAGEAAGQGFIDGEPFDEQQAIQPQNLLLNQTPAIALDSSMRIKDTGEIIFQDAGPDDYMQTDLVDTLQDNPHIDDIELGLDLGDDPVHEPELQQDDDQRDLDNYEQQSMIHDRLTRPSSPTPQQEINDVFESVEEEDEPMGLRDENTIIVARAAPQRNKAAKGVPIDNPAELQNSTLGEWDTRYLHIMQDAHEENANKISVAQAKRNAAYWVLDQGVGGVSADFREDSKEHPLAIFSGETLLDMIQASELQKTSRKRSSSAVDEGNNGRRVRPRSQEDPEPHDQDDFQPGDDEEDIPEPEMGREQEVPLSNGPADLPWNDFASSHRGSRHGSVRPPMSIAGVSSSAGGLAPIDFIPSSIASRRISRLIQESPLDRHRLLRHSSLAGSARTGADVDNTFDEDDFDLGFNLDETVELDERLAEDADHEMHGPVAPTMASKKQAADSQWPAATLEQEAYNFLSFLATTIEGKLADEEGEATVTFEELLPPPRNSHIVAAQGLLHVLSLATKGLVEVLQEEPFGSIEIGIAGVAAGS